MFVCECFFLWMGQRSHQIPQCFSPPSHAAQHSREQNCSVRQNNPEGMNALRSTDVGVYCDSVCFCVLSRTSFCSWWIGSDTLAGGWCHFLVSVVSVRKCRYLDSGPVKRQLFICYNQNNKLGHHRRTDMFCSFIVIVVFVCAFLDGIGAAVHKKMLSQL